MKDAMGRIALIGMLTAMSIGWAGCVSVASRWEDAKRIDTLSSYESFLREFPQTEFATQARERAEQLKFEQAKNQGTENALNEYLKEYPSGANSKVAREMAEQARRDESTRELGELMVNWAKETGAVPFFPRGETPKWSIDYRQTPADEIDRQNLSKLHALLAAGANPNALRIQGFSPANRNPQVLQGTDKDGRIVTQTSWSNGNAGKVVNADNIGITLLIYCKSNSLNEAYDLLKSYGAK